jgi:hypothetical protein
MAGAPAAPAGASPPPPPPPSGPASVTCPTCKALNPTTSKFCNSCGASLPAPVAPTAPPSGSAPPVDIRQRIDQDRGTLKRLQLLVPGFRGYRQGEDVREADSYLRMQVAAKVHNAVGTVQDCRQSLTQAGQFQSLTDLAAVLSDLQVLEGSIRHAEQGYTGISPAVRVNPDRLDRLYEYDYGFAQAADQMAATLSPLRAAIGGSNPQAVTDAVATVRGQVRELTQAFKSRMNAVEGISI